MIKFYADRIRKGKMTIDQVPEKWRAAVRKEINENNPV